MTGFRGAGLEIADGSTIRLAESGGLTVQNSIFFDNSGGNFAGVTDEGFDIAAWATTVSHNNSEADPKAGGRLQQDSPRFPSGRRRDRRLREGCGAAVGRFLLPGELHRRSRPGERLDERLDNLQPELVAPRVWILVQ